MRKLIYRYSRHLIQSSFLQGVFCCLLLLCTLWHWPVPVLQAHNQQALLLAEPALLGSSMHTRSIHSVQLTPLEDSYILLHNVFWQSRSRIQSHNAGLPFAAPSPGRFYVDSPWMVLEGGRKYYDKIHYRIGTEEFGRNEWHLNDAPWIPLFANLPKVRLDFQSITMPLSDALRQAIIAPELTRK